MTPYDRAAQVRALAGLGGEEGEDDEDDEDHDNVLMDNVADLVGGLGKVCGGALPVARADELVQARPPAPPRRVERWMDGWIQSTVVIVTHA